MQSVVNLKLSQFEVDVSAAVTNNVCAIYSCTDLWLDRIYTHGVEDIASVISPYDVRDCTRLKVTGCEFEWLYDGFGIRDLTDLLFAGNYFHHLRQDGFRGSGLYGGLIEDNFFTDFYPQGDVGAAGDHPDAIQLWTKNAASATHDVVIRRNKVVRGDGHQIQGTFVQQDPENPTTFTNITIEENVYIECSTNGIKVDFGDGIIIRNNILYSNPDEQSEIRVFDSDDVSVTGNRTKQISLTRCTNTTNTGNSVGSWQAITAGDDLDLSAVQALSLQTVSTSETPASDVALATVSYHDGAGDTGSVVSTSISVDIAA